jgi:methylamine---glutamate N-methyltransferase subunit B
VDALRAASVDAAGRSARDVNDEIRRLLADGAGEVEVRHPGSRHNLAAGILSPGRLRFRGDVGYFCAGLSDGLDVEIDGDCGWSLAADMVQGRVVVHGRSGSSTAAAMRGGLVVVHGDAGARTAIALKGGTVVVGGSVGYMSGFMMQKGRLVVCGDAGPAFGDSMYLGELFCGGAIADLGSDTLVEEPSAEERAWLAETLEPHALGPRAGAWQKVRSAGKLWRYDKREFAVWRHAL